MKKKQKIVVVGLGSIGRRHARLLAEREDVSIAYCDPQKEMLAIAKKEIGDYPEFYDFKSALDYNPDIMVIATPHHLHVEQTLAAIKKNIHILCEKPVSHSLEEAEKLAKEAKHYPAVVNIGYHLHFHPGLVRIKELISSGKFGNIIHAHCRVGSYITLVNSSSRYQEATEGALLMDYAHQPDMLYWLLRRAPTAVRVIAGRSGDMEFSTNPNFLSMTLAYDTPMIATVHLNYVQMPERHEYEIVGDEGWALLDGNTGELRIGTKLHNKEFREHFPFERDQMYKDEYDAFFDAVKGKCQPETSAQDGLISMKIIAAALVSLNTKRSVDIKVD